MNEALVSPPAPSLRASLVPLLVTLIGSFARFNPEKSIPFEVVTLPTL